MTMNPEAEPYMVCVLLVPEWRAGSANEVVPSIARPAHACTGLPTCGTSITNS